MTSLKSRLPIALAACAALTCMSGCAATTASNSAAAGAADRAFVGVSLIPKENLAALTPNLAAQRVVELLGRPDRVKPINAANIRAEIWVYRISRRENVAQVEVGQRDLAIGGPTMTPIGTPAIPVYRNETTRVYQTIELLIIDDRLQTHKPGRPKSRSLTCSGVKPWAEPKRISQRAAASRTGWVRLCNTRTDPVGSLLPEGMVAGGK